MGLGRISRQQEHEAQEVFYFLVGSKVCTRAFQGGVERENRIIVYREIHPVTYFFLLGPI